MLENFNGSIERIGHVALCPVVSDVALASSRSACDRFVEGERLASVAWIASTERQIVHGALACSGNPRGNGAREGFEERVHDALRRFHVPPGNGCGRERIHDGAAGRDHAN